MRTVAVPVLGAALYFSTSAVNRRLVSWWHGYSHE